MSAKLDRKTVFKELCCIADLEASAEKLNVLLLGQQESAQRVDSVMVSGAMVYSRPSTYRSDLPQQYRGNEICQHSA